MRAGYSREAGESCKQPSLWVAQGLHELVALEVFVLYTSLIVAQSNDSDDPLLRRQEPGSDRRVREHEPEVTFSFGRGVVVVRVRLTSKPQM
jgi:hypothetical protein